MEEGKDVKVPTTVVAPENKIDATTVKKPKEEPRRRVYRYGMVPNHMLCQYYMDREKELYERACKIKANIKANPIPKDMAMASGPSIEGNVNEKDKDKQIANQQQSKAKYRYTLEEMKCYNPYRHYFPK